MSLDPTNWKTPANIVANVIANKITSLDLGVNLFVGFMPDKPSDCITVIDTGGGEQDPVNAIDNVSIQIYSRNKLYETGYNLQNLIKSELQSLDLTILDDETIIGLWVKSNIAFIGRDESDRSLFSANYRIMIDTKKDTNRNSDMNILSITMPSFLAALNIPSYANLTAANLALPIGKIYYDESLFSLQVTTS